MALLVFRFCVGVYYPSIGFLRGVYVPMESRYSTPHSYPTTPHLCFPRNLVAQMFKTFLAGIVLVLHQQNTLQCRQPSNIQLPHNSLLSRTAAACSLRGGVFDSLLSPTGFHSTEFQSTEFQATEFQATEFQATEFQPTEFPDLAHTPGHPKDAAPFVTLSPVQLSSTQFQSNEFQSTEFQSTEFQSTELHSTEFPDLAQSYRKHTRKGGVT